MNGQQRLLLIFLQLMDGKKVNKLDLMAQFDKKESTIQRDIVKIEEILSDEIYQSFFEQNLKIERDGKGGYQLKEKAGMVAGGRLVDIELLMLLKIVASTRILTDEEFSTLITKIINLGSQQDMLKKSLRNELFHYQGIATEDLTEKIDLINEAIQTHQTVEFEYTKNGETRLFQRMPNSIYFSDIYFFMLSSSQTAQDDRDFEALNKFRINNIKKLRIISSTSKRRYSEKFEGGMLRRQTQLPFLGNPIQLVIDFYYEPAYVLDRFPDSKIIRENPDGSLRIELQVNDGYGTKMWLAGQGHMVKVISPKHMRDYVIQNMKETLKLYDIEVD